MMSAKTKPRGMSDICSTNIFLAKGCFLFPFGSDCVELVRTVVYFSCTVKQFVYFQYTYCYFCVVAHLLNIALLLYALLAH